MKKADMAVSNQRLRRERELRGWSQKYVADQIGAERYYLSRWERGITFPSCHYRQRLCLLFSKDTKALGLLPDEADDQQERPIERIKQRRQAVPTVPVPISTIWTAPYRRNPLFMGREAVLQGLHDTLHSGQMAAQVQAVSGLGGIGKTQTVVEYAYRYRHSYQAVLWVRADTHETLVSDLAALADVLHLPESDEPNRGNDLAAVERWLSEHTEWLLILDNIEDLTITSDFLPTSPGRHILLTTRAQVTGTLAQRVDLEKMEPEEGALLLLRRAKLIQLDTRLEDVPEALRTHAINIVQVMDGLPLALDQAGAYLEETACSLSTYLDHFQKRHTFLLDRRGEWVFDHPISVRATFSLDIEKVEQANPAAAELLRFCAFLHPDAIPEEIITEGAAELDPILGSTAADPIALDAVIKDLRKFSLLHRNSETKMLTVHRLVQAVIKDGMDENTQRQWAERTVQAVANTFPVGALTTWSTCQCYLLQAHVCAALITQWNIVLPAAIRLLYRAGYYLREHAQDSLAEPFFQQALLIYEQTVGARAC